MVNTTSKRKRKSHNNRTRLSRRVKRGGEGWLSKLTSLLNARDSKEDKSKPEDTTVTDAKVTTVTEAKDTTKSKDKTKVVTEEALDNMLITDEATYLQVLNNTRALYNLTYETINKGVITDEITDKLIAKTQSTKVLERVLKKINDYNIQRLNDYEKLFKTTIPVYPYARIQTPADKTHLNYMAKAKEIQDSKNKKTYTNDDYYIGGWGEGGYELTHLT